MSKLIDQIADDFEDATAKAIEILLSPVTLPGKIWDAVFSEPEPTQFDRDVDARVYEKQVDAAADEKIKEHQGK